MEGQQGLLCTQIRGLGIFVLSTRAQFTNCRHNSNYIWHSFRIYLAIVLTFERRIVSDGAHTFFIAYGKRIPTYKSVWTTLCNFGKTRKVVNVRKKYPRKKNTSLFLRIVYFRLLYEYVIYYCMYYTHFIIISIPQFQYYVVPCELSVCVCVCGVGVRIGFVCILLLLC